jgi:Secretion system C-terminal sorting domain
VKSSSILLHIKKDNKYKEMKRIITSIAFIMALSMTLYAQLPSFEWRLENGQLTSSKVYTLDIYLYNTGASSFELRGGTIGILTSTAWRNGGTISVAKGASDLVAGQQTSTATFTPGTNDYFRVIITSLGNGSGTTFPAGSRKKCFTVTLTNTVDYSTSVTPNFAWKFNGAPSAGFNYTDGAGNSAIVVNNATNTANQAYCYTPTFWNGTQWNSLSKTTLGTILTTAPTSLVDAVVSSGTLGTGSLTCRNYELRSGATHNLGANTLSVSGNMVNNGTLSASTGTLNLVGTTALQTADQTVSGSGSFAVANLGFGVAANAGTKTLSTGVSVGGAVTQSGTAVLASGGNLTLLSVAGSDGTARINQLTSGAAITGNIRVERFIPATGRKWRFLSSPVVGGTTLQWRDNAGSTTGRGILITGGNSVDYDLSTSNAPSLFSYNEASTNGGSNINAKWSPVSGNATLTNGLGYRAFVRGDRTISLTTVQTTANPTTIWVSGTYPSTPVNMPVTYNSGLGNGWNLVGNPFPCQIDWNAASGWSKTNVSGTFWVFNPSTNTYGSYDGSTTINGVTRYIGSGQAFFIQTNDANPVLTADEAVKVGSAPAVLLKTSEQNSLRIQLVKDSTERDETVIRFMENKSDEFNATDDVLKYAMNANVNISSYYGVDKYTMVNYLNSRNIKTKVVALGAWVSKAGVYTMNFNQIEDFDANINIYLKDNFNNTLTDLRLKNTYEFNVEEGNTASTADGRLEVIFVNTSTSIEEALAGLTPKMEVYPNPAVDVLHVSLNNVNFKESTVSIYNVSGQEVMSTTMVGKNKSLDIEKLSNGVYMVKVTNSATGYSNTIKFVK